MKRIITIRIIDSQGLHYFLLEVLASGEIKLTRPSVSIDADATKSQIKKAVEDNLTRMGIYPNMIRLKEIRSIYRDWEVTVLLNKSTPGLNQLYYAWVNDPFPLEKT